MKSPILFFLLLESLTLYSWTINRLSNKIDKTVDTNLDFSNKKFISKDDSIQLNSMDLLLSCGKYSYFPKEDRLLRSYFSVPYNGCVFNPKYHPENKLGWAEVFIIPKSEYEREFSNLQDHQIDSIEEVVNKMGHKELKLKFDLIIFLIEKKYLQYVENAEINYYPKLPYVKKAFVYRGDLKKWTLAYSVKIEDESEESKWTNKVLAEFSK